MIIPTLNEAQGIGLTIQEIQENLGYPEILVIDANSIDGTPQIATRMGAKVIKQQGLGKGRAIAEILQRLNHNNKYFVIIDGDYTYPANFISQMVSILEDTNAGMVTGERFSYNNKGLITYFKSLIADPYYFGRSVLTFIHHKLNGVHLEDPLTGLRVIKYEFLRDFRPRAKSFDIEVEINNHIRRKGAEILEIPIGYRLRLGEKKLRFRHGFVILMRILFMAFEEIASKLNHFFLKRMRFRG